MHLYQHLHQLALSLNIGLHLHPCMARQNQRVLYPDLHALKSNILIQVVPIGPHIVQWKQLVRATRLPQRTLICHFQKGGKVSSTCGYLVQMGYRVFSLQTRQLRVNHGPSLIPWVSARRLNILLTRIAVHVRPRIARRGQFVQTTRLPPHTMILDHLLQSGKASYICKYFK